MRKKGENKKREKKRKTKELNVHIKILKLF